MQRDSVHSSANVGTEMKSDCLFFSHIRELTGQSEEMKPASRRWTSDENTELDRFLDAGKEAAEIAVALNRIRQVI